MRIEADIEVPKHCRTIWTLGQYHLFIPGVPFIYVERWPSHLGPPDHYGRLSTLLDLSKSSQSQAGSAIALNERFPNRSEPTSRALRYDLGAPALSQTTAPHRVPGFPDTDRG